MQTADYSYTCCDIVGSVCLSVYALVTRQSKPCKNGWTDRELEMQCRLGLDRLSYTWASVLNVYKWAPPGEYNWTISALSLPLGLLGLSTFTG